MKLLLLFGVCIIAIAARREWDDIKREEIREDGYRTQRVYRYLYRGQISSGLPKESTQHAATRIEAHVSLVFPNNERTAVLRLEKVRFGSLNHDIPEPRELQRFEIFEEKEVEEEYLRLLRLPLRFRYVDGLVSEIEFDREDRPWSQNIKRAVLNLLQVNLKKNMRTDIHEERNVREDIELLDEHRERREDADFFVAQEPTLEGDCEVYYTINRLPREEKEREELLKVTKSINFEKCSRRIEVRYNHRFGEKCDKCDEESEKERVTKTSTVFNYNIIGNRDKFLVKNAEVKSQYVLAPLGEDEATMKTVVVGRLELLKVDERRERWEEPRSERKQSIIYSPERLIKIERFYMNGDEELREDHPFRLIRHKYELIDQTVSKMVRAISDKEVGIETDATRQMARLVELFRMCSKEELHKVVNEFWLGGKFDEKTKKKVYDIVVDALALAGTKNTIELLVEQIEQRRVSTTKTAKALQTLVNVRVVSERQIDTVLRLCKKDVCERNPLLKQSCLLSVGGMINALCKDNKDRLAIELTEMRICPRELKEKYLRMVRAISDKEVGIETDATRQMARLVELFRMCSKEELHKVVNEFWLGGKFDEKTKKKVYDIVVDALALAGTKNTIELLVEQIEQRRVSTTKTAKALQTLVNVRVVSERQIDTVLRLCKKDVCERNPLLKQSCLLSVGGMINALCKDNKDRLAIELTEMRICPRELKEKYLRELMEIFRNAETRYEKVLALKTLANAGIDLSVYELEKIITDRKEERIIRAQAIDALRQLRTVMPRKIQRLLLPVFKDKTEYPEIRITALAQIMHTLPERTVLDQIAEALLHEQSRQVQSFTYSMMRTFAVSRNPCEKRLGEDLRLALNLARVDITNWTDSKYIHIPLFDENRKVGLSLDLASIFTKDSTFPRELMMSLDTIVAKQWRKSNIQLGLVQYNLEEIVEKLVKETEEKSLEDIVVRQRRAASFRPTDILHSLYEKLNIRSRREKSSVYAMAYLRFKNLDFAIVPIDAETLPEALKVMRDGKIDLSRLEGYLTRGCRFQTHFATYFHEVSRRLPTTIGMPLVITDKIPTIIGLEGEFKTVLTPQETKRLNGAKINLQVRPTVAATHLIRMHIWNPVVNSGIKMMQAMRFNLPIDAEVELLVDRKLQLKYRIRVPQEKKQIFAAHTRLVTITSSWPIDSKIYAEPKLKTVPLEKEPQRMRTFEKSFGEKWIGIRLNIRGQWHDNPLRLLQRSPMLLAAGENAIEVTMEKTRDAPREIVSEFDLELLKESRMQKPELEKFYSEKSEDRMFEIDSSEESDEDVWEREERKERRVLRRDENREQLRRREEEERLRRQEFSRYVREYNPQKGYKLRVLMRINAVGSRVERKAEAEISTGCDERMRYCMFVANGRRTPMFEDERRDWTFKTNIQSLYPEPSRNIKELSEKKYREFNAQIQCEWGSERREHINMKIQGEQDREQRELMNRIDRQRSPVERYDEIMEATQLNQYKIVVDYEVCPVERYYFNSLFTLLKSWQLWNSQIFQTENAEKRIFVKVTIDPRTHQFVTLVVETPRETVEIRDIFLPMRIAPLMLNTHRTSYPVRSLRQFVRKTIPEQRAECTVSSRRVNTFDGAELKLPLTTCYSVLAKDCRSAEPRFAVLMKKLRKDSDEKKMKIIDEERVIEMQRVGREIEVRVDGRVENDEEKLERMGINKRYDIVIVELEDVTVHFDGEVASVKVSPWFKNGQCGICGHYDGERDDELRKADNELTDDLEQYHRSYFNKDTECDVEEDVVSKKENYRIRFDEPEDLFEDSEEERERDEEVLKPVLRTHVIEYNQELCFSMKGVPECPKGTYAKESQKTEMKVSFACLSRSRHEALRLARRARTEVINMGDYKPSFVDTIMVPRACVAF
ncbi:unnamed protein product [Toxocara canis]|uniref:Vitellogenin domain-containing protein n=2 Tax=Toxocara canis TaxID=6265 RepID=A0A183UJK5_TOXCA|nr:unnamed protein product [Toxocara canis]